MRSEERVTGRSSEDKGGASTMWALEGSGGGGGIVVVEV